MRGAAGETCQSSLKAANPPERRPYSVYNCGASPADASVRLIRDHRPIFDQLLSVGNKFDDISLAFGYQLHIAQIADLHLDFAVLGS